jgi:hypothetical protein
MLAQGELVVLPREMVIERYLDRLESTVLRQQEEGRVLRVLSQQKSVGSLSSEALPQALLSEEKRQQPILSRYFKLLENAFEGAQLRTGLAASIKFDDNVHLAADDTKSDWIYDINPSIDLKLVRGQSYLGIDYNYDYRYYLKNTAEDETTQRLTATLFYKPSNIFSLRLFESFEGTGIIDLFELVPFTIDRFNRSHDRVNANRLSTVFTYMPWGRTNMAHLTFADERTYSEERSLESNSQQLDIDIEHYLNPITSVYFGYGFGVTYYEEEVSSKDTDYQSIFFGLKYDLTKVTKAAATFTFYFLDYDDGASNEDYKLDCILSHKLSSVTNMSGTYTFGFSKTAYEDYRHYNTNKLALSLTHQFNQKLSMSLTTAYILNSYCKEDYIGAGSAIDRNVNKYDFNLGFNHRLYKWLNLNFSYRHARTISEFADESYGNNVCTVGARVEF